MSQKPMLKKELSILPKRCKLFEKIKKIFILTIFFSERVEGKITESQTKMESLRQKLIQLRSQQQPVQQ